MCMCIISQIERQRVSERVSERFSDRSVPKDVLVREALANQVVALDEGLDGRSGRHHVPIALIEWRWSSEHLERRHDVRQQILVARVQESE